MLKPRDIWGAMPILVYDDRCSVCINLARLVRLFAFGRIHIVGHYTGFGEELMEGILGENARTMFWYIDRTGAYGGRCGIAPLIRGILTSMPAASFKPTIADFSCSKCSTPQMVYLRLRCLMTNSKRIAFTKRGYVVKRPVHHRVSPSCASEVEAAQKRR